MDQSEDAASKKIKYFWLLGFVAGDVTRHFFIKSSILVPYFQLAQHNKNIKLINFIKDYLSNLSVDS